MAVSVQKPQVFNPAGYIAALGAMNGKKGKKKYMPNKKKGTKSTAGKKSTAKKKTPKAGNPMPAGLAKYLAAKKAPPKKVRKSGNPDKITPVQMAKEGLTILSGLVATRQLPQLALKEKNTGLVGYGSNAAVAAIGGIILGMTVSPRVGFMFAAGGSAYLLSRAATENLSPIGKYFALSGVGDAQAASVGDCRRSGVGIVVESSYSNPQLTTPAGKVLIPPATQAYVAQQIAMSQPVQVPVAQGGVGRFRR